ncbi:hypothetical protein E4O05_06775 [Treponema sp. OMZ 787]|uniref:hypothetical protein n=1 Tax=Treponema sp. OMZ 787 TaxID=2563669 RepID=UPI0020A3AB8A|nr:hypothetical protein [Treponema sp. OMZ 787]UTC61284.1 hypothetical protein E4O05_06775 [Treponema sp. OMZ 787]
MENFLMNVSMFFYKVQDKVSMTMSLFVMAACIIGIVLVLFIASTKVRKINSVLAIVLSAVISCILMIPLMTAFNSFVSKKIVNEVTNSQLAEIEARKAQIKLLAANQELREKEKEILDNKISMQKQSIEIDSLEESLRVLQNTQLNMHSFKEILELGLLEANLKQTNLYRKNLSGITTGMGLKADQYYDEGLVVLTHDIDAKFGVDLKKIKITVSKDFPNILWIRDIQPKFLGASKNKHIKEVAEIRRVDIKNNIKTYSILNGQAEVKKANQYADLCEQEYQTRLSQGFETNFMNDAVLKLSENFIKLILSPLKKEIRFAAALDGTTLSLEEYIDEELKKIRSKRLEIENNNKSLDEENLKKEKELENLKSKIGD